MKKTTEDVERLTHAVQASKVKTGDLMAFVYYTKIEGTRPGVLKVADRDNAGQHFEIQGDKLIERGLSADQYEEEVKVTKTRAAEILVSAYNRPLTVCFEKTDGTERVLRGRLIHPEPLLGRSMVEDLDLMGTNRRRLVDHRTIRYLILEGVKHVVK